MTEENQNLQKRIDVLMRKLDRERKARESAEQMLEQYSKDIFSANQSLQRSLSKSEKRQQDLEFLNRTSLSVTSETSVNQLFRSSIELTGEFFHATYGLHVEILDGEQVSTQSKEVWQPSEGWHVNTAMFDAVASALPENLDKDVPADNWIISDTENMGFDSDTNLQWSVSACFELSGGRKSWIVFLTDESELDEESLFVLDTARSHLLSGIRRRIGEIRVLKRNRQLHDTIEKLETARQQLIQSEKMASLGQLAAGVAHEINNPIGYIRSNTEVLNDYVRTFQAILNGVKDMVAGQSVELQVFLQGLLDEHDFEFVEEDCPAILKANIEGLDRIREIVDSLKSFSHSNETEMVPVSLNSVLQNALKVAWNALKYDHTVTQHVPENLPLILGNEGQLQQVFINLFVNAAQAMKGGGELTIDAKHLGNYVQVRVSDTGEGMSEQTQKELFTPFYTTKKVGEGTGLGLSVSYAILEAHDAEVKVESKVGEGSTFILQFPMDLPDFDPS